MKRWLRVLAPLAGCKASEWTADSILQAAIGAET